MNPKKYQGKRLAILAAAAGSGAVGGAERFYAGLVEALRQWVGEVDLISLRADESTFEDIQANYDHCAALDFSTYDAVISTKAPTYVVRHPRHILYLVHTIRVFYDMYDDAFPVPDENRARQRALIHRLDTEAFREIEHRFTIGHEVSKRLETWNGVSSEVLHPPLLVDNFRNDASDGYFFMPGRLHAWKRCDLAIRAVKQSSLPLRLIIAGTGEAEEELKKLADGDPRISFLGFIDDARLVDLYASALAVVFLPVREDYGYVTLEAFKSGKPVITCSDSGEPLQFVKDGRTGIVCAPDPASVGHAMEALFSNPSRASEMGAEGQRSIEHISWSSVGQRLADAAFAATARDPRDDRKATKVAVLDMQPIDPPVGGGRLRLLGLYHALGDTMDARYVGSYDWPGESYRSHRLSPSLLETNIPLSPAHHAAARQLAEECGGKTVIDLAFAAQAHLTPDYVRAAIEAVEWADVVVCSHPWAFPVIEHRIKPTQLVVYDSQNVEGYLRAKLLDRNNPAEAELVRQVVDAEFKVGSRADLIIACSQSDLHQYNRIYEFPFEKMRVAPNGAMVFRHPVASATEKSHARGRLGLASQGLLAIFIGSEYGPNVEAAEFIVDKLAVASPDVVFVIAGGVGAKLNSTHPNVIVTGHLTEAEKQEWLLAVDIAVNPMLSGSGTNIKMFDFFASSLPVVSTAVGARGIEIGRREAMIVVEPETDAFAAAIDQLKDGDRRGHMGREARAAVEENYSWERISGLLGTVFKSRHGGLVRTKPFYSVVVPTYERHRQLDELVRFLQRQIDRDFEVVIIDQSENRWENADAYYGFPCVYFHSPVKGAVRARNTGAMLAQGQVIAFTDDDCRPSDQWLSNARKYFEDPGVVGVEGQINSDHLDDPAWRPVTNVGFEGIGFMTANLMIRSGVFQRLGGFDLKFDRPHFREDTDLGWRMQELGKVPYAPDVCVFHPAQPRAKERESSETRAKFFQNDALLYKKHPERYRQLFRAEGHYLNTSGFREHLLAGFASMDLALPDWLVTCLGTMPTNEVRVN